MKIIALEGIDGAGKSTLLPELVSYLDHVLPNTEVMGAAEFQSPLGKDLMERLPTLTPQEKVLWFAADRCSTLEALDLRRAGESLVVWDRYTASAFAYRSADAEILGLDESKLLSYVREVNSIFPPPILSLYIDVPIDVSLRRQADSQDLRYLQAAASAIPESSQVVTMKLRP